MKPIWQAVIILVVGWMVIRFLASDGSSPGGRLPTASLDYLGERPVMAGAPVLLEFWATWCGPCRDSIPHLNKIHGRYKDRGLVVVGVTDESREKVRNFQQRVRMDYPVAIDAGRSMGRQLGVRGIPAAFLVNRSGEIVWRGHPMSLTDAEIEKIL